MNTPKKRRRASTDHRELSPDSPAVLFMPVPDGIGAFIGAIVTDYTDLERKMIGVFRVILGIESGEAATLAYSAIRAPSARWEIARRVLEHDHGHINTSTVYDDIIDEFLAITGIRNRYVHGLWRVDAHGQPWLAPTDGDVVGFLKPRRVRKAEFESALTRMHALRENVIDAVERDLAILDRRWLARPARSLLA